MSDPKTEAWLIEWDDEDVHHRKVSGHNCIADYRAYCKGVNFTVDELVRREALEAARKEGYEEGLRAAAEKMPPLDDEKIADLKRLALLKRWSMQQFARALEDAHGIGANFE